jgi:diguanylate cyclase (GGDEF)-like protein/PAS domain S-box-containing protein
MTLIQPFANDVVAILRQTPEGVPLECNDACARMLGYAGAAELLAAGVVEYANASDLVAIRAALGDLGTLTNVEVALRRRDGVVVWVLQSLRAVVDKSGAAAIDIAMLDVTEQRLATQRFEYQAYHDSVTGLPNRMLFFDRVNVALAHARRRGDAVAIAVLDLDEFNVINARHGRSVGDRVLRSAGERIANIIREEDAAARLEGDDFVILLAGMPYAGDAAIVASRLLAAISEPHDIDGEQVHVHGSIGISIAEHDGELPQALVRNAAAAAAGAAERGGNAFRFYEPELNQRALERASMVARLRKAVDNGELELYYQPEVNVQTGSIQCIEALLRWRHPDLGLIPPNDFLGAAEQGGLLSKITEIVVAKAFRQLREWHDSGLSHMRVAVNLLANQLGERSIPSLFLAAAEEFGVRPSSIEVEFPEIALSNRGTQDVLLALKELELLLAIDDFGTGRCAITDLKRLPIDTIKIAPSLVKNMVRHNDDDAIVQAMLTMAKALDLRVVAEGVESKEQFSFLLNRRCTEMQGFFVARPAPAAGLEDILRMQHH